MRLALLVLVAASAFAATAAMTLAASRQPRRPAPARLVAGIAAASSVLAMASAGEPVGLAGLDVVARGAFGFVVVLLGSRASASSMLAGSVVAVAAGAAAGMAWAGAAIVGSLAAAALAGGTWPLLGLSCLAGLVQVALRLETPAPLGSAALAALILGPIVASGLRRLPVPSRRKAWRAALGVGGLVAATCAPWAITLLLAQPSLSQGDRAATDALEAARRGDLDTASARFGDASKAFATAQRAIGGWWTRPALFVPFVARNARAVDALARAGADLTTTAAATAPSVDPGGIRLEAGVVPLDRLRALDPPLRRSLAALAAAERRLEAATSPWVVPPVHGRLAGAVRQVRGARGDTTNVLAMVRVLPGMLGAHGPRRYFLAIQTPSEARATGGLIGNFGEVTADGGRLQLVRVGRSADLNSAGDVSRRHLAGPADYLRRYAGFHPETEWRNVNLSPHFPSVAEVIGDLYPQSGGQPIDGVISVDPLGLAALLEVVGPVPVAGLDQPLTARNAGEILLFRQYLSFQADNEQRVEFLGDAATAIWARMTAGRLPGPSTLGAALGPALDAKHFLFSSRHPEEQRLFERLGVDGGLPSVRGDSLAVVTQNAGGNKIDWFLKRSVRYDVRVDPSTRALAATLDLRLANEAPATGLPPIVIHSSRPDVPPGENRIYLSVFTPWSLAAATVDGRPLLMESGRERGRRVYSAFVTVPPGGTIAVSLQLSGRLPARRYSLDVFSQTTVHPDDFAVDVNLPSGWNVSRLDGLQQRDGRRATRSGPLTGDLTIQLAPRRNRSWLPGSM